MHAEFAENILSIGKHIHEVADGSTLITTNITDAALQQRLGDGQDTFAGEFFPGTQCQLFDFLCK